MTITPEDIVRREVAYCCSTLVSTLAPHWGAFNLSRDHTGLSDLFEQAGQLACSIDDWQSTRLAIDGSWYIDRPAPAERAIRLEMTGFMRRRFGIITKAPFA